MPITTRSGARHDVADMYSSLLSNFKAAIGEGVDPGDMQIADLSSDEDDQRIFGDTELPASRTAGDSAEAVLATPAAECATAESPCSSAAHSNDHLADEHSEEWPLAAWEHQLSMPTPAAASTSKPGVADWTRQKAQPSSKVRDHT